MILGNRKNLSYLESVLKKGTMAHAYLFYGPEAVGKKAVAFEFAKSVLCREGSRRPFGGCGRCQDCREAEAMAHPDLIMLSRDRLLAAEELKREIGINNIRELHRILGLTPWRGGRRAVIIDNAEALSGAAQSAVLKIMEEPPAGTIFMLISASAEAIYPTIRSRSVLLPFSLAADEDMEILLINFPDKEHPRFFDLAQGQPGVLVRVLGDAKFSEELMNENSRFRELLSSGMAAQFAFSEAEAREPGKLESLLKFMVCYFRHKLKRALENNGGSLTAKDYPEVSRLALFLGVLTGKLSIIETAAVNRRLLSDSIFYELQTSRADKAGQVN